MKLGRTGNVTVPVHAIPLQSEWSDTMRTMMFALGAITMAIPTSMVVPVAAAKAGVANTKDAAAFDQRRNRKRHHEYR